MDDVTELDQKKAIWQSFSTLFLDTDVSLNYDNIVKTCVSSCFTINQLQHMLYHEVTPACGANFISPAGEWAHFDDEWLVETIIKNNNERRGFFDRCFNRFLLTFYVNQHWQTLKPRIIDQRQNIIDY